MTPPNSARLLVAALLVGVCVPPVLTHQEQPQSDVSVKQFGANKVIGHLGHPLGTVVRITGRCINGDGTHRRADLGKTLLEVRTVNEKELEHPFVVPFLRAAKDVPTPADGDSFDYYAHEWGAFDGIVSIPKDLAIDQPMVANDGCHYQPQITIHKSIIAQASKQSSRTKP
ncbi:hypothetical protein [Flavobacterium sp.]|jgi:hypothetical protein|uniref:hypothetical protein n=1 Tax=Flavobacterium sp. TaxID=239 RepID=UPI0037BEF2FF